MRTTEGRLQTSQFGSNPKKIMCQCNAEEMIGEVITIQMSGRCPICNSFYQISIPKLQIKALQTPKQQASVVNIDHYMERRMQMARELNARIVAYRSTDWVTGVLAL
ncbi:MAG: hypothetical protein A2010_02750 [Nitrospirae bacterium GWD2_57_9]|nr:MAG: hypothetical protein A2010_02750 [Nitrospirae bacterium GWD2_57_9]